MENTRAPATARARARDLLAAEIKATARRHLADVGAAGLSLRAVARELGMASSAVYRYYENRDALLTALIVDTFDAVGEVAEKAVAPGPPEVLKRWTKLSESIRQWAVGRPYDYALIYGSPVPGYKAPDDTVLPAARVSLAFMQVVSDGVASGQILTGSTSTVSASVHSDLARLRDLAAPKVPDEVLARAMTVWTGMFGHISYELFGHMHRVIEDYADFFHHQTRRAGLYLMNGPSGRQPTHR